MNDFKFIHLRVHSAYSLAEGAIHVKDLVTLAKNNNMPAVAVTDTSNMFGALDFALAGSKSGIQPIIGVVLKIDPIDADENTIHRTADNLVLIAQNRQGYMNLLSLVSESYTDFKNATLPLDILYHKVDGVICLTGGYGGALNRLVMCEQRDKAEDFLNTLHTIFQDRLYIELHRNNMKNGTAVENVLLDMAYDKNIPIVATNAVFFATPNMHKAHDALLCIDSGHYIKQSDRRKVDKSQYFKSTEEMISLFSDLPEALENTVKIAKRCAYIPHPIKPLLPIYPYLDGRTEIQALTDLTIQGLQQRLETEVYQDAFDDTMRQSLHKQYMERMDYELGIIAQMGFPGYFLIVADFIQWAKKQDIPVGPGRGSGAGSVVAWALKITNLDPMRWGLLFERFLNPERVSMPDFDIDFCQNRRGEVIEYVQQQYGRDKVAQIITFGKLKARAVVRDVGRVLGVAYPAVNRICKFIPNNPTNPTTLKQALESEENLRIEYNTDPTIKQMIDLSLQLEGLYRHTSTHAAGVVIGDRPLQQLVPLYQDDKSDMPATQFNLEFVEQAGLVKFDFLGLTNLTIIQMAVTLINTRADVHTPLDIDMLPLEDAPTYEMLTQGNTIGIFQLESAGMRKALMQMKPDRLEDIIAVVSLYRPGPMENIPTYIGRKHGEMDVEYLHPVLEPILRETFGIPVYQEQVMQMAQVLAGYTLGGADLLRRAMGKKDHKEMDKQCETFIQGAYKNHGVDAQLAHRIFEQIKAFAGYGFNKSHAAAYAMVAYQTAWLKCKYPVEFMVATMTYALQNTDRLAILVQDLKHNNIVLLPPDVNQSDAVFSVDYADDPPKDTPKVRYAMAALKNVGEGATDVIVAERQANGPFIDIYDFFQRVDYNALNKSMLESLIKAGAFDGLYKNRRALLECVEDLRKYGSRLQQDKNSSQSSLFGDAMQNMDKPNITVIADYSDADRLQQEYSAVGFYVSGHPLSVYRDKWKRLGVVEIEDIKRGKVTNDIVRMCGMMMAMRSLTSKDGKPMAIVDFSDASGVFTILFFDSNAQKVKSDFEQGQIYLIYCHKSVRTNGEEKEIRLIGNVFSELQDELSKSALGLMIHVSAHVDFKAMADYINGVSPGKGRVLLQVQTPKGLAEIDTGVALALNGDIIRHVKTLSGVIDVTEI